MLKWLFAWRTTKESLKDDIEKLKAADVVYFSWAQFFDTNTPQQRLLKHIRKGQFVVLYIDVCKDEDYDWNVAKSIAKMFNEVASAKGATLLLQSPTDTFYDELAKELKAPWFKMWIAMPFALHHRGRAARKEPFFLHYTHSLRDKGNDIVEPMLGVYPIVQLGDGSKLGWVSLGTVLSLQARSFALLFPSRNDSVSRMLIQAGMLLQVPILLRTKAAFWRTLTFGLKDNSFFYSAPIAKDENVFYAIVREAFNDWTGFYDRHASSWLMWFDRFREFWDAYVLWERWHDEMPIPLSGDLYALHQCYWLSLSELLSLPDGPWKKVEFALNAPET